MPGLQIPYQPLRASLYSPEELLSGFDPLDPDSLARTLDFRIFRHFVAEGRTAPRDYFSSMMQSLHDNSISQALAELLAGRRCVAVMGGHKLGRDDPLFAQVAVLSRELTRRDFLVASGGGPGAMEATHLGAALAHEPDEALAGALALLSTRPGLPHHLKEMVRDDGSTDPVLVAAAHSWYVPAMEVRRHLARPGVSLAIPTWHYGHEPASPFASHLAKYFQNSIREDGLLAIALHGIIFAPGKAGTIQEIFQDAAQNYYRTFKCFSPMVLLDSRYWTEIYPVEPLMRALFPPADYAKYVLVTDSLAEALGFIEAFTP